MKRFEEKYVPDPNSGCWLWTGAYNNQGYGVFWLDKKTQLAHRVSYNIYKRTIPDGLGVLHTCDVPSCVNPSHLFLGTQQENSKDMVNKGRCIRGTPSNAKLTKKDVKEIRDLCKHGPYNQTEIGFLYNVSPQEVSIIKRRIWWKMIK